MVRVAPALCLVALLCLPLAGQVPAPAAFEVADVHPSVPAANGPAALNAAVRIGTPRNGRYEIRRATMVDLIRTAYGVEADKVLGGPHWLEMDRFDVIAKTPPSTTRDTVKPMLQALLASRFGLAVRQEIKPVPSQVLVRTGGELRLKEAPGGTATTCQQNIQPNPAAGGLALTMTCRGISMAAFGEQLTRAPGLTGLTGPVVDGSGLPGTWDFDLVFSPAQLVSQTGGTTFIQALGQLGIKLEAKDVPLPTITVERVNRQPTPNDAAAVAAAFPPGPPPEFEVAEIKPSAPGTPANLQILPNGQLNIRNLPLRLLISLAWRPPSDASISGVRGIDNTFDVIAKMSTSVVDPQQVDTELLGPMLQTLLTDRLNLKVRWEDREVKGYSLVRDGTHKLVKSDPESRTRCASPQITARTPTTGPMQTLNCQNITMTEFVERLQQFGGNMFQVPVLDETGLEGRWNFTISFSPPALVQALANARANLPPGATGAPAGLGASDPTGVMTLEEAIDRQMGLKLRARQRQGRVLVVDYVEDTPTPNR